MIEMLTCHLFAGDFLMTDPSRSELGITHGESLFLSLRDDGEKPSLFHFWDGVLEHEDLDGAWDFAVKGGEFETTDLEKVVLEAEGCSLEERLLVAIPSSPGNGADRDLVRKLWGSKLKEMGARVVFFVGRVQDIRAEHAVFQEHQLHRDIVQSGTTT